MKPFNVRKVLSGSVLAVVLSTIGCAPAQSVNPFALKKENTQLKSALRQYQDQLAQNKNRAEKLDEDNEQLHNLLAQEQEARRHAGEDQSRFASRGAPRPPIEPRQDEGDEDKEFGPSSGRKGGSAARPSAKLAANSRSEPRGDWATLSNIQGAEVLRDGEAVRVRVTNTSLFDPGKATLKPGATKVLDQVASSLRRNYSGHLIGIEGHTDRDPIKKSNWKDNHELSVARAMAVYEYLRSKGGVPSDQLYVAGFGPNAPIASNSSSSGKAQNRRVEFVVQPENARASVDGGSRR